MEKHGGVEVMHRCFGDGGERKGLLGTVLLTRALFKGKLVSKRVLGVWQCCSMMKILPRTDYLIKMAKRTSLFYPGA